MLPLPRELQRLGDGQDPELLALGADDPDFPHPNALVDPDVLCLYGARSLRAGPAQPVRPTVRVAERLPISAASSATMRSTGTAPRSSPVRRRRLAVPLCGLALAHDQHVRHLVQLGLADAVAQLLVPVVQLGAHPRFSEPPIDLSRVLRVLLAHRQHARLHRRQPGGEGAGEVLDQDARRSAR